MEDMNSNGKGAAPPPPPPGPPSALNPEDILHQVSVVITKDNQSAIIGDLGNLPLLLHLLAVGVDIVGRLVSQAIPKLIIPVTGPLPPGVLPFGRKDRS